MNWLLEEQLKRLERRVKALEAHHDARNFFQLWKASEGWGPSSSREDELRKRLSELPETCSICGQPIVYFQHPLLPPGTIVSKSCWCGQVAQGALGAIGPADTAPRFSGGGSALGPPQIEGLTGPPPTKFDWSNRAHFPVSKDAQTQELAETYEVFAREPGRLAYEAMLELIPAYNVAPVPWAKLPERFRASWRHIEQLVVKHVPRR